MHNDTPLAFDTILQQLAACAVSKAVKTRCLALTPAQTLSEAKQRLNETTEARLVITTTGTPPLSLMTDLQTVIALLRVETLLTPEQIGQVSLFLMNCGRMRDYLKRAEHTGTAVAAYGSAFADLSELEAELTRCVQHGLVVDRASQHLYDLRRSFDIKESQIKTKLEEMLRKNTACFSESFYALRNGRYTLPVKKEYRHKIDGTLVDMSNSGGTCFIEPASIRKLQDALDALHMEEDNEVRRILYALTAQIYDNLSLIKLNMEAMETLDFLFAKGKLSIDMQASPITLTTDGTLRLIAARHPLLCAETAVPLDFALGGGVRGIIITGPNTGGKTVALKTAGLLPLMAQSGLHVPADSRSHSCLFDAVLCDIGDGQSILENLSTFSAHIRNIIGLLQRAEKHSLVLLDELGSGTDPAEGMGIAMAVLEALLEKGCLFAATTHYPEIKTFATHMPGLLNARMAFDRERLLPLYRLEIGTAGESCALHIAEKLGMPASLLRRARYFAYHEAAQSVRKNESTAVEPIQPLTAPEGENILANIGVKKIASEKEPTNVTEAADETKEAIPHSRRFSVGDSVLVYPRREIGIVYAQANAKGEVGVQIKGQKRLINHKRLKIKIAAEALYPDGYDMSIVFDSVENRKARHVMTRKHVEGNTVILEPAKK